MSEDTNLLAETCKDLADHGKQPADVRWVGSPAFGWWTWDDFAAVADTEYDDGFGGQNVARDLMVVGDDWWLERHEYDGSEWWEFKTFPTKPDRYHKPETVIGGGTLGYLHGEGDWEW